MATSEFEVYVDGWNAVDYKHTAYIAKYKPNSFPLHEWHYEFEITDAYAEKTAHVLKTLTDSNGSVYCLSFVAWVDSRFNRLYKLDPSTYYPPPEGAYKRQPIDEFVVWYLDFNIDMQHMVIDNNDFLYIAGVELSEEQNEEGSEASNNVVKKINHSGYVTKILSTETEIKDFGCDHNNFLFVITSKPSIIKFTPNGEVINIKNAPPNSRVLAVR
jgi:hypothetical protein